VLSGDIASRYSCFRSRNYLPFGRRPGIVAAASMVVPMAAPATDSSSAVAHVRMWYA